MPRATTKKDPLSYGLRFRGVVACSVVGTAMLVGSCQVDGLDLVGKSCPCAAGWVCEESSNLCVRGGEPDAGTGAGGGGSGGSDAGGGGSAGGCTFVPGVSPGQEGPRGWPSCDNDVDDDCDVFVDGEDADCGYRYSVVAATEPPVVDGDCIEYAGAQSLTLRADEANVIVYWLMWDETALYVCGDVTDGSLDAEHTDPVADRDGDIWRDDALELLFDVDHDGGDSLQPGDYKFFLNVAGVVADSEDGDDLWNAEVAAAVQPRGTVNEDGDTDGGFTAELAVTWASWGIEPPTGDTVWGGDLMWDDRDDVAGTSRTYEIWSNTVGNVNTPDGFGDLLFLP